MAPGQQSQQGQQAQQGFPGMMAQPQAQQPQPGMMGAQQVSTLLVMSLHTYLANLTSVIVNHLS